MNNIPWVDKYRPYHISSLAYQDEVKKVLLNTLKTGNLTNFIFYGPPGTGKTSAILALSYELFGPKLIKDRVLELNASDQRGINIVREIIINFAKKSLSNPDPDYPSPPYKLIILDEADAITLDAQSALRQIIETSSKITRFCFTCNYIEKIIQPIISRCVKFRFKPLSKTILNERLVMICEFEKIKISKECINRISEISEGDCRRAIMILQNCKYILEKKKNLTVQDCNDVTGSTGIEVLNNIWENIIVKDIININNITKNIIYDSININNLLQFIKNKIIFSEYSDSDKSRIIIEILNINSKLLEKGDEYLQILYLLGMINNINNKYNKNNKNNKNNKK
jgi:replication factor C subunit 2/4